MRCHHDASKARYLQNLSLLLSRCNSFSPLDHSHDGFKRILFFLSFIPSWHLELLTGNSKIFIKLLDLCASISLTLATRTCGKAEILMILRDDYGDLQFGSKLYKVRQNREIFIILFFDSNKLSTGPSKLSHLLIFYFWRCYAVIQLK